MSEGKLPPTKYCKCETWPRCLHEGIEYQTAPLGYTDQYLKATEMAVYRGEPLGQVSILLGPNLSNHFMLIPGEVTELRDFLTEVIDRRQQFVEAGCPPLGGLFQ